MQNVSSKKIDLSVHRIKIEFEFDSISASFWHGYE